MAEDKSIPTGANKYSVYAQRDVESTQLNWGQVSKDIIKTVDDIRDDRQKRKDEIETSTQDALSVLNEIAETTDQSAGEAIIKASNMSVEAIQTQYNLVKRNKVSQKQFNLFMQRQKNGYASVSKIVQAWDKYATTASTRLQEGKSGFLEVANNESVDGLSQFRKQQLVSHPVTGDLVVVDMDYNEETKQYDKLPTDLSKYHQPNTILGLMKFEQNKFLLKDRATNMVKPIATIIDATIARYTLEGGGKEITSIEDFRQLGDVTDGVTYDDWLDAQVTALAGKEGSLNSQTAAQILAESGSPYAATKTLEEFNEKFPGVDDKYWIQYSIENGMPVSKLTAPQQLEARNLAKIEIESQISSKITKTSGFAGKAKKDQTQFGYMQEEIEKAKFDSLELTNDIVAGDLSQFDSAGSRGIISINQRLKESQINDPSSLVDSIKRQGDEIVVIYQSGRESKPVERKNKDGSFKTTQEIGKEVHQLISPYGASYDEDSANYIKSGKTFTKNTRDMTKSEIADEIRLSKATETLILEHEPTEAEKKGQEYLPSSKEIKEELENMVTNKFLITQEMVDDARKNGIEVYSGQDSIVYASLDKYGVPEHGSAIIRNDGDKIPSGTGAEEIKKVYNKSAGNKEGSNDSLDNNWWRWMGGYSGGKKKKQLDGVINKVFKAYLPRKIASKADIEFDAENFELIVKYNGKPLKIEGATDKEVSRGTTFTDIDKMINIAAKEIAKRESYLIQNRKSGDFNPEKKIYSDTKKDESGDSGAGDDVLGTGKQ